MVHEDLTHMERQGFGQLLAVIHRGNYYNIASSARDDIWNNFFPDIFRTDPEDSIIKFSYEQSYFQILTISDPRHTRSADPRRS